MSSLLEALIFAWIATISARCSAAIRLRVLPTWSRGRAEARMALAWSTVTSFLLCPGTSPSGGFDLTGMQPRADEQARGLHGLDQLGGAGDGTAGAVEGGKNPVPGALDDPATETGHVTKSKAVMGLQQVCPLRVAQRDRPLGGADDVGQQHCGEHAAAGRGGPVPVQELLHRAEPFLVRDGEAHRVRLVLLDRCCAGDQCSHGRWVPVADVPAPRRLSSSVGARFAHCQVADGRWAMWRLSLVGSVVHRGEQLAEDLVADGDCLTSADGVFGRQVGDGLTKAFCEGENAEQERLAEQAQRGVQRRD